MNVELTGPQALVLARMTVAERNTRQYRLDNLRAYTERGGPAYAGDKERARMVARIPIVEREIDHYNAILEVLAPLVDVYQDELTAQAIRRA